MYSNSVIPIPDTPHEDIDPIIRADKQSIKRVVIAAKVDVFPVKDDDTAIQEISFC